MKRVAGCLAVFGAIPLASAQVSPYGAFLSALDAASKRRTSQPMEPPGNPGLPAKTPNRLPAPGEPDTGFRVVRAGNVQTSGDLVDLTDGGEILIRGYRVFADRARGNRRTQVWELEGNVRVIGRESVVSGPRILADFNNETFRSFDSESQLSPNFVGSARLKDLIYVKGQESFGKRGDIHSLYGDLTTCTYDHPHYDLTAEDSRIIPGRRAILRRVRLRLFDRTLLNLPYLVIPLEDRNYRYTPDVGRSPDEGYYVKNRYGVAVKGDRIVDTRLDYMEKLGTGTGVGYAYQGRSAQGEAKVYQIQGKAETLNFNNRHQQNFRWGQLTLQNDYQRNNYLTAPKSVLFNNRADATIPWGGGNTRLGLNRSTNDSSGYSTVGQTINFGDTRSWRSGLRTNVNVNHVSNESNFNGVSQAKREQIDLVLRSEKDVSRATAAIDYQRSIPIGENANFFGGGDRTPVVTLASDARRLFGDGVNKALPFRTELSVGEFQDQTGKDQISRGNFDFAFNKNDPSGKRFTANYNGQFRQGLYSDDTAQYVMAYGTGLNYRLGPDTGLNLRYNYLRPFGFTPLSIDRTGKANLVTLDATTRPVRFLKIGMQTGYDMQQFENNAPTPWQQVGVRTELQPSNWFLLRGLSTYDTFRRAWSSVRLDLTYKPGATLLSIGARYDGIQQSWSNVNIFLNNLKVGRTRVSSSLVYNGYTKRFESREYSFIYDLHCAEAVLNVSEYETGYRPGRQLQLMIRLKAFPFNIPFGTGRRGQPLGTGGGRDF